MLRTVWLNFRTPYGWGFNFFERQSQGTRRTHRTGDARRAVKSNLLWETTCCCITGYDDSRDVVFGSIAVFGSGGQGNPCRMDGLYRICQ